MVTKSKKPQHSGSGQGISGLRELLAEAGKYLPPEKIKVVEEAYHFAAEKHESVLVPPACSPVELVCQQRMGYIVILESFRVRIELRDPFLGAQPQIALLVFQYPYDQAAG